MRRRFFRGKRKRTVSWVAGISSYDPTAGTSSRLIAMSAVPGFTNLWGVSIGVVLGPDLPIHGGEDAVLTRVVGRLGFLEGRKNAGAGLAAYGFQMRLLIVQSDMIPQGTGFAPSGFDFTSSLGEGNDDILFMRDTAVSATAIGGAGTGFDLTPGRFTGWVEFDVGAQRKVQEDRGIILWMQTIMPAGPTGVDFRMLGGLRTLIKRPA